MIGPYLSQLANMAAKAAQQFVSTQGGKYLASRVIQEGWEKAKKAVKK